MPHTESAVTVAMDGERHSYGSWLDLPFMKEQTEGQCQMNERGRRAWIISLGAHTSRGENMTVRTVRSSAY